MILWWCSFKITARLSKYRNCTNNYHWVYLQMGTPTQNWHFNGNRIFKQTPVMVTSLFFCHFGFRAFKSTVNSLLSVRPSGGGLWKIATASSHLQPFSQALIAALKLTRLGNAIACVGWNNSENFSGWIPIVHQPEVKPYWDSYSTSVPSLSLYDYVSLCITIFLCYPC